jgi:hypothetical protein
MAALLPYAAGTVNETTLQFTVSACKLNKLVNLLAKPFSFQSLHAN